MSQNYACKIRASHPFNCISSTSLRNRSILAVKRASGEVMKVQSKVKPLGSHIGKDGRMVDF